MTAMRCRAHSTATTSTAARSCNICFICCRRMQHMKYWARLAPPGSPLREGYFCRVDIETRPLPVHTDATPADRQADFRTDLAGRGGGDRGRHCRLAVVERHS